MATTTTTTNKPLNPRAQDLSPKGYNRANIFSGKALDFDGVNDYVDGGTLDITAYTQMSVSFYMNVDTTTQDFRLISIRYIGADDIRIFHSVSIGGGILNFSLDDGDVDNIGVNFETNQWYHVVMTHDGTTLKAYFNGVEQASTASTFDYANANGLFYVGRYTGGDVTYYDGEASNVKIFNTALTAAQVADLYLNPEKIVPDGVASSALKLWLPMMEGAGASAYDGSGNGNDGTINGATWTAGIGAPVAQTALVSWNKGSNLFKYSEQFNQGSAWVPQNGATISANATTAPNGTTTADLLYPSINNSIVARIQSINPTTNGAAYTQSVYVKAAGKNFAALYTMNGNTGTTMWVNLTTGAITNGSGPNVSGRFATDEGNGWWRIGMTDLGNGSTGYMHVYPTDAASVNSVTANGTDGIYLWGGAMVQSTTAGAYIKTNATAQTSAVLVPEGLTAGASIFGTNIITPRNAFALNLDGASWAEVHDNASLDITSAITLEAWFDNTNAYDSIRYLFDKSDNSTNGFELRLFSQTGAQLVFRSLTPISITASIPSSGWVHVAGIYDGTNTKIYVNGIINSTLATTGTITANDYPLTIGGDVQNVNYSLNKPIALPRIYNRALTAAEVLRNYNSDRPKFGL
jgi:hypothetical protein